MHINNDPSWLEVTCEGEVTGRKYHGKFQVKPYLTISERKKVSELAEEKLLNIKEDQNVRTIYITLATLQHHILKTDADWWKGNGKELAGEDLYDEAPIAELVKLVNELQRPKELEKPKTETPSA